MKVIAIEQFGGSEEFVERELPTPKPGKGEVRIRVQAVGFNPVDYKMRQGVFGKASFPLVLGLECSGVVEATGDPRGPFAVGDEVFAFVMGASSNGTYAETLTIPTQFVSKKPKNLTFEEAAGVPLTYLTAFQALIATGALQKGRPFFLAGGSGGVGSAAIALAKVYGAGPIFTTAGSAASQSYLLEHFSLDPEHILLYNGLSLEQMSAHLIEKNGGKGFYLTFDCVGEEMKQLCFSVADFYGHVATILPESEEFPLKPWGRENNPLFAKSLSLHVTFLGAPALAGSPADWRVYGAQLTHLSKLFENEGLRAPPVEVLGDLSVETVREAHTRLESGHTRGKLILSLSGSKEQ